METGRTQVTVNPEATETPRRAKREPVKARGIFEWDGERWICWFCTLGHKHRGKLGARGLAKERHAARRREVREARREGREFCPNLQERERPVMFKDICRDYRSFAEANKRSHKDDRPRLTRLLRAFRRKLARDITAQDVEALKVELTTTARGGRRGGDPEPLRVLLPQRPVPAQPRQGLVSGPGGGKD